MPLKINSLAMVAQGTQVKLVRRTCWEDLLTIKAFFKEDVALCCLVDLLELLYVRSLAL